MSLPPPLNPPVRLLLGPGPSEIHPRVLRALGANTVGHLDPYYLTLMDGPADAQVAVPHREPDDHGDLGDRFQAGMESTVVNLIEPGDSMLVCVAGVFGTNACSVAGRAGAKVTRVDKPWGEIFEPND